MSLRVSDIDVAIGATSILRRANLELAPGTVCGLIGRNGAGKTTLMRAVMGFLRTTNGAIRFADADLTGAPAYERVRHGIGYMPEDRKLVPDFTASDNILLPVWAMPKAGDSQARLDWIYSLMPELQALAPRRANQLSGGQQKMVALARALMAGTKLLLLDEPTEGLAPALAQRLAEVLARLRGTGLTVLLAESNDAHVAGFADNIVVIERGVTRRA